MEKNLSLLESGDNSIVIQSNELIESGFTATLGEMRLIYFAMKKIKPKEKNKKDFYLLNVGEYCNLYGISRIANGYDQMRKAINTLKKKPIVLYQWNDEFQYNEKTEKFWFDSVSYFEGEVNKSGAGLKIKFTESISDYLFDLQNNFTKINFEMISKLDTVFSFRLYSWLSMFRHFKKHTNQNGVTTTNPIDLSWIRERTGLVDKYPDYKEFKRNVLSPAMENINKLTDFSVTFKEVKVSQKVVSLIFSYIVETGVKKELVLPKRPQVLKGTHLEGEWARECISVILNYKKETKLDFCDLDEKIVKKLASFYKIIGDDSNYKKISKLINY